MLWSLVIELNERQFSLQFGHAFSRKRTRSEREGYHGLGMDALAIGLNKRGTISRFGNGCSDTRMRSEHESCYGLAMDALATACIRNT